MQFDQLLYDGEAEPQAAVRLRGRAVLLAESLKNTR